jgi:DhnA family fructose-bisphosphate aldolase class Ia
VLDELGSRRRLRRLVPGERPALWLPLDDGLISGPEDHLRDVRALLHREVLDHVTAVLGFRGLLVAAQRELVDTPFVMNLSASTTMGEHTRKIPVGTVRHAISAGADAVACHVNMSSPYETEQLEMLGGRVDEAQGYGLPVVAFAYPRGRRKDGTDENYTAMRAQDPERFAALVRHCVRVAVEVGASVVKTIYTGSERTFASVVESAMGVPVLIAGEKLADEGEAIDKARGAVRAGAAGVAYGRQIFARPDPLPFLRKLRSVLDDERPAAGSESRTL